MTLMARRVTISAIVTVGSNASNVIAQSMAAVTVTIIGETARVKKTLSSLMLAAISVTRLFPFPLDSPVGVR